MINPSLFFTFIFLASSLIHAQTIEEKINHLTNEIEQLEQQKHSLYKELETYKLAKLREDLNKIGLPKTNHDEEVIHHAAMSLVYSEKHEQAKWVAHIILPEIIKGKIIPILFVL